VSHLVLPMIVLGTVPLAIIARMTRSSMLEVLGEDYIRTARAKGLSKFRVVGLHAFRNALIPVITVIGLQVGVLFTGAILMGFAIPGSPLIPADNPFRSEEYERIEKVWGSRFRLDIDRYFDFDADYGYVGAKEQKKADPYNTWMYDMSSWASIMRYDPAIPLGENTQPILYAVGENDPTFPVKIAQRVVDATSGPVEFFILPDGRHQLMLFHTEQYSQVVLDWCHKIMGSSSPNSKSTPKSTKD